MIGRKESACNLPATLAVMEVKAQVNDELVWPLDSKGLFNIKSFCRAVYDRLLRSGFPSAAIWRSKAPPKAFFFCLGCRFRKSSNGGLFEEKKFPWA